MKATGGRAMTFICLTVLIDTIGFGIIIPVMPELIMSLGDTDLPGAARIGGRLLFIYALMQFFCAPIVGNLSDRFGRRPVLLLSLFGFGVDYFVMGFAPNLWWLFLGRIFAGIFGATYSTANAYVADASPPDKRAANFGLVGAVWGVGFILGPMIGGMLAVYGTRVPFFAAGGLALANVLYGYFVLPETLAPEHRRPFDWKRANPAGALMQMRRLPAVLAFFGVIMLYQIAHDSLPSTWTYFAMELVDWSEREVGWSLGFVGLMSIIVQGGLIRVVIPRLGEPLSVCVGLVLLATGFLGLAFSTQGWMLYVFIIPLSLGGIAMPALRGILSNGVPQNAQGELHGAVAALASFVAIFAPLMMTEIFRYYTADATPVYFPGAAFFAAGLFVLAACLWFLIAFPLSRRAREAAIAASETHTDLD